MSEHRTGEQILAGLEADGILTVVPEQRPAPAVQHGTLRVGDNVVTSTGLCCTVAAVADDGRTADVVWDANGHLTPSTLWNYPVSALDRGGITEPRPFTLHVQFDATDEAGALAIAAEIVGRAAELNPHTWDVSSSHDWAEIIPREVTA